MLVGEAATLCDALAAALEEEPAAAVSAPAADRIAEGAARVPSVDTERGASDAVPLHPERLIKELRSLWPADGIVTADAGENRLFMMQWFRQRFPGGYLQPAAGGGMGYSIPAALGAKLAHPDRSVLAVCGDGGFAMTISGLMTAVQEKIPITVVVFNNNALGWVLHGMGEKAVAAGFDAFDHAKIAESLGCTGVRVTSVEALQAALRAAPGAATPTVIDVPVSLDTSFLDVVQDIAGGTWKRGEH
jgi:acetolactate synthase-1/2/3 large subunit